MLTAMNVSNLPPALLRSGRVELWLETRLPDAAARASILDRHLQTLPSDLSVNDREALIALTEGLTGADLQRIVEDGKVLLAYDKTRDLPLQPLDTYLAQATATVKANKERYAAAEAAANARRTGTRPPGSTSCRRAHRIRSKTAYNR